MTERVAVDDRPSNDLVGQILSTRACVIEASAGTGKTYTLEQLALRLIDEGVPVDQLLIVTFTEKATEEVRVRLYRSLAQLIRMQESDKRGRLWNALQDFDRANILTIHGFCQKILNEYAFEMGTLFQQTLVDRRALFSRALHDVLQQLGPLETTTHHLLERWLRLSHFGSTESLEQRLFDWHIARARIVCGPAQDTASDPAAPEPRDADGSLFAELITALLPKVEARMAQLKQTQGFIDFDDMLTRVQHALSGERASVLIDRLRLRYQVAVVDEFQDTDDVQWAIFRTLFLYPNATHRLYLIGDPKQAIYGFRGADVYAYDRAKKCVIEQGGKLVTLDECYRSTPELVRALDQVFSHGFFSGDIAQYRTQHSARSDLKLIDSPANPVCVWHLVADTKLAIDAIRSTLARRTADEILRLVNSEAVQVEERGATRRLNFRDVFVLTRSASEAEHYAQVFRERGIPCSVARDVPLFQSTEAEECLTLFRALQHTHDPLYLKRVFLTLFFAGDLSNVDTLDDATVQTQVKAKLDEWARLMRKRHLGVLYDSLFYQSQLSHRAAALDPTGQRLQRYQAVLEWVLARLYTVMDPLQEAVERLERAVVGDQSVEHLDDAQTSSVASRDCVGILTMHKAKGLEAAVVFVGGGLTRAPRDGYKPRICHQGAERVAWLGQIPREIAQLVEEEDRQDDQRLLYVALTRAKLRVYLPFFGSVRPGQKPTPQENYTYLRGSYLQVNQTLARLVEQGVLSADSSSNDLFGLEHLRVLKTKRSAEHTSSFNGSAMHSVDAGYAGVDMHPEHMQRLARPFVVTSYSQLKASLSAIATDYDIDLSSAREDEVLQATLENKDLIQGTTLGIYVHDVLEHIDFCSVASSKNVDEWVAREDVRACFKSSAKRRAIADHEPGMAERLVYASLRTPVKTDVFDLPQGLCAIETKIAEMPFNFALTPFLSSRAKRSTRPPSERGFIRGAIDMVFEHEGRFVVVDWKSDRVDDARREALERYVADNYTLQVKVYSLALLRFLQIKKEADYARFGGILYAFLRLMDAEHPQGYYFVRPSWSELCAWDKELGESDQPWGYSLYR